VIDVDAVAAIDVHVHTERSRAGHDPMPAELRVAAESYFRSDGFLPTVDDVAAYYRERHLAAVVFTVDWESRSGIPPIPNEEIAEAAAANSDVLIPFASVDPARPDAVERVRRLISEHGVKGFKFHPNLQAFFPNAPSVYPLYEAIAEAGLPDFKAGLWYGFAGPRGTPQEIVTLLNGALNKMMAERDVLDRMDTIGVELTPMPVAGLAQRIKDDYVAFGELIRATGMRVD